MAKNLLYIIVFLCFFFVSCSSDSDLSSYVSDNIIELPEESSEYYINCIDSVTILSLSVDKDWVYVNDPFMSNSSNSYFLLDRETYHLIRYDKNGNKTFSKVIRGRGRGEVLNVGNIFCINDSVCIFDIGTGRIVIYDNQGQYKGFLNTKNEIIADVVFPMGENNYVATSNAGFSTKDRHFVSIMDKDFKIIKEHISLPNYIYDMNVRSKNSNLACMYDDTLRFMLQFDYNVFSVTPDTIMSSYYLKTSNPIQTSDISAKDKKPDNTLNLIQDFYNKGYASFFSGFGETERFIMFNYVMNQKKYNVLIDKKDMKSYSFSLSDYLNEDMIDYLDDDHLLIWKLIISNCYLLYCDGDCAYCSVDAGLYNILKSAINILDDRLMKLYNEMNSYYTNNIISENDKVLIKVFFKK